MNIKRKIMPYVVAAGISMGTLLGGCSATKISDSSNPKTEQRHMSLDEKMRVLGTNNQRMLEMMPGGYTTTKGTSMILRTIAGIYAGTAEVNRTDSGYSVSGSYSSIKNPEALIKTLKLADTNNDRLITRQEASYLKRRVFEEYAK